MNMKFFCKLHLWFIVKLLCFALVIVQTSLSVKNNFFSGKTVTRSKVTQLNMEEFPMLINIIVKPGFDTKRLWDHGYANVYSYFLGLNQHANGTNVGNAKGNLFILGRF